VAYRRGDVAVVVPRFWMSAAELHENTTVELPPGTWCDVCTGTRRDGGSTTVAALTESFPVWVGTLSPP
jgi:hypothetical protein